MQGTDLDRARMAYAAFRWEEACEGFGAQHVDELADEDLAAFADASWWCGRTDASLDLSEVLYRRCLAGDDALPAARLALDMGFLWLIRGEATVGSGWLARAHRLLAGRPVGAEHGYLHNVEVLELLEAGRLDAAAELARAMCALGRRHGDPTLCALATVLEGVADVRVGRVDIGLARVDEAMLAVRAGEVRPSWAGNLYCQVMSLCIELGDTPRARAWTDATERWCQEHGNAAMFTGICRVHRAQLLHLEGDWAAAERSAERACRDLADMNVGAVAAARYELGELHRRRGDLTAAEAAYTHAQELGHDPQPGLALLRLAQGRTTAARTAVDASLATRDQPLRRAPQLAAQVTIAGATGDTATARAAADELRSIAERFPSPVLVATARHAEGSARRLTGDAPGAVALLRDAASRWRELSAPFEAAQARLELSHALTAIGDLDGAGTERATARRVLADLGASLDAAQYTGRGRGDALGGLTGREQQVLELVATGATNAAIATRLTISERTVERHLSNLFAKLEVSSRTEAARVALLHGLAHADGR